MTARATARLDRPPVTERREASRRSFSEGGLFIPLAIVHAAALVVYPSIPLIALALWWNANTIAHNFIHRPFFPRPVANRAFSAFLSLVLGFPHDLWRQRHLRHHAETAGGPPRRLALTAALTVETALVATLWTTMVLLTPRGFLFVYLPGWLLGLALCQLQGYFEHARGTTSHYGRVYNTLFFNDGYHVEHHLRPTTHWSRLPALTDPAWQGSRWPAVLRLLDRRPATPRHGRPKPGGGAGLEGLERLVLRSSLLQRFVIDRHARAFRRLLPSLGPIARITIIGGGLFPRTALILRQLLPHAALTIVDASEANLRTARRYLPDDVACVHAVHSPGTAVDADLVVVPLAYRGDRSCFYRNPPAARVIVHDWIWRPQPATACVSWLLLKRLNLVRQ
jgi:hypothetical protein